MTDFAALLQRKAAIGALQFDDDGNLIPPTIAGAKDATSGGASPRGSSYYTAIMTCPRMWFLRYKLGLVGRVDRQYRLEGTLIHRALAYHWAQALPVKPAWHDARLSALTDELHDLGRGYPVGVTLALNVMEDYRRFYSKIEDLVPVAVEECFYATIDEIDPPRPGMSKEEEAVGDEVVSARPDVLVHVKDASPLKLFVVDHKTEGRTAAADKAQDEPYPLKPWMGDHEHTISFQQTMYLHVMRAVARREHSDVEVCGSIIQRVRRQSPSGFARHDLDNTLPRAFGEVPRTLRALAVEARRIGTDIERGVAPRWHTWSCQTRWGACDYRDICKAYSKEEATGIAERDFVRIGQR